MSTGLGAHIHDRGAYSAETLAVTPLIHSEHFPKHSLWLAGKAELAGECSTLPPRSWELESESQLFCDGPGDLGEVPLPLSELLLLICLNDSVILTL